MAVRGIPGLAAIAATAATAAPVAPVAPTEILAFAVGWHTTEAAGTVKLRAQIEETAQVEHRTRPGDSARSAGKELVAQSGHIPMIGNQMHYGTERRSY